MPDYPDRQSAAFREAEPADWRRLPVAREWRDGDPEPIRPPEFFGPGEILPPKDLTAAKEALADRIADPHAPDGPESLGAYDHLGEG